MACRAALWVRLKRLGAILATGLVAVAALSPSAGAARGLRVGSDISAPPFEYFAGLSGRIEGFDADLLRAMRRELGAQAAISNHEFRDLIPAVRRGQFDFAMSAMSDTRAREKLVDFVDYFLAGGGIMVRAGNPHRVFNLAGLCGYRVTVVAGSLYESILRAQSASCRKLGMSNISVLTFGSGDAAFDAFANGNADAYVTDYPTGLYRARSAGTRFEMTGSQFDPIPYGIAVRKGNHLLRMQVVAAMKEVVESWDSALIVPFRSIPESYSIRISGRSCARA
jgi:polar amino acid transport system substrate-binding protein